MYQCETNEEKVECILQQLFSKDQITSRGYDVVTFSHCYEKALSELKKWLSTKADPILLDYIIPNHGQMCSEEEKFSLSTFLHHGHQYGNPTADKNDSTTINRALMGYIAYIKVKYTEYTQKRLTTYVPNALARQLLADGNGCDDSYWETHQEAYWSADSNSYEVAVNRLTGILVQYPTLLESYIRARKSTDIIDDDNKVVAEPTIGSSTTILRLSTFTEYCNDIGVIFEDYNNAHFQEELSKYIEHIEYYCLTYFKAECEENTAGIENLKSSAIQSLNNRRLFSDVVSQANVTLALQADQNKQIALSRLANWIEQNKILLPYGMHTGLLLEACMFNIQHRSVIVLAFKPKPPLNNVRLQQVFQINYHDTRYCNRRDRAEQALYANFFPDDKGVPEYIKDIEGAFNTNLQARPVYAALRLIDNKQGLGGLAAYGDFFIMFHEIVKHSAVFLQRQGLGSTEYPNSMSTFFHPESFLAHCSDEMLHGIAHWAVTGCFPDGFNQQRHQNPGPIEIHIPQLSFTDPNIVAHIHLASDNDNHAKQFEKRGIEATRGDSPYTYLLGAYRSIDVLLDLIKKYPILLMASVLDNNNVSQTHGTTLLLNGMLSKKVPRVYRGAVIQMFFFEQLFHFSRKCDQAVEEILKIMKYEAISIASLLWAFENILKKVGSEEDKETFDKIVKPQIMPILSEIGKFPILSA